VVLSAFRKF
jgi:hypothetical protein